MRFIFHRGRCTGPIAHYAPHRGLVVLESCFAVTESDLHTDVQPPMERLAMYEVAINQVYTLCSRVSVTSVNSGRGEYVDAAVRARIFWYAHAHEGITTGLRGGRLLLCVFLFFLQPLAWFSSNLLSKDRTRTSTLFRRRFHLSDRTFRKQPWDSRSRSDTRNSRFAFRGFVDKCTSL